MNELNEHCTLCLSTNKKTIDIFGDDGKILAIAEIISKHFWIQVIKNFFISFRIFTLRLECALFRFLRLTSPVNGTKKFVQNAGLQRKIFINFIILWK